MSADLFRALGVLCEAPGAQSAGVARALGFHTVPAPADFTELFMMQLPPYASIYVGPEGKMGGEARDRVAGFWRALGLAPPAEPDHLAALLGLYASLRLEGPHDEQREHARMALLWEHLASWLPRYLVRAGEVAPQPYEPWIALLAEALQHEMHGMTLPALPLHLRESPPLTSHGDLDAVIEQLLTPVVSGIILTRADLDRAAAELALGVRRGERRFVLRALLAQAPAQVLEWLAQEAMRQRETNDDHTISHYWASRAEETSRTLQAMQHQLEKTHAAY